MITLNNPSIDQTQPILLVDSHNGIYTAQVFAERVKSNYDEVFTALSENIGDERLNDMLSGPDNEFYLESYDYVLSNIQIEVNGELMFLSSDEDLWLMPYNYEFE